MGCVSSVSSVSLASSESVSATLRLESTEESDPQRNELLEMASQHWPTKWYEQHVAAPALTRKVYVYYIYIYIYIPNLNSREPDPLGDLGEEEQGALCPPRQDRRAKLEALPFQLSSVDTIAAILRGGFAVEAIYEVSITQTQPKWTRTDHVSAFIPSQNLWL